MTGDSSGGKDTEFMLEQVRMRMKMLQVIHLAMVTGMMIFGAFILFFVRRRLSFELSFQNPLILAAVLLPIGSVIVSFMLKKPALGAPVTPPGVHDILNKYQVYFLIRASIIEGGALFAGVATLVTFNIVPAVMFFAGTVALAFRRPSQQELVSFSSMVNK